MSNSIVELLLDEVLSGNSLKAMEKTTGASSDETSSVITTALPILLQGLSNANSSSKKGTSTVEKLLETYSSNKKLDIAETIEKADENEGLDVLSAILGKSSSNVEDSVSKSTGVDKQKVVKILASIIPIVLTFVSYQNKKTKKTKKSNDTADQLTDLLGDLIGVATKKSNNSDIVVSLLSALLK